MTQTAPLRPAALEPRLQVVPEPAPEETAVDRVEAYLEESRRHGVSQIHGWHTQRGRFVLDSGDLEEVLRAAQRAQDYEAEAKAGIVL